MIKFISSGLYSSIQDFGRFDFVDYGVPVSGAMDQQASKLANAILGNSENEAVLEFTLVGPTIQFLENTFICLSGAYLSPKLNNIEIPQNKAVKVKREDILSFGPRIYGVRTYLAVSGGYNLKKTLGSYSMFGGISDRKQLLKGDILKINMNRQMKKPTASVKVDVKYINDNTLEVFKGPEFDLLSSTSQKKLLNQNFTISNKNNRMGYQLNENLSNTLNPIITSLVLPGTVQVTPSGKLIILMRDCQTTGGYPRILQLSEAAINKLAQKTTNDIIKFAIKE